MPKGRRRHRPNATRRRSPPAVCLQELRKPTRGPRQVVAAVVGYIHGHGQSPEGIFGNIVHVPTTRPDAQHAADLGCALKAPPSPFLDDGSASLPAGRRPEPRRRARHTQDIDAGRRTAMAPPAAAPRRTSSAEPWSGSSATATAFERRGGRDRKMASFRAGLERYAAGGTMDGPRRDPRQTSHAMSPSSRPSGRRYGEIEPEAYAVG